LTEEEDTRTGTHSKWRTDVWTGLQPLARMRKQNVLIWLTTNSDFQHYSTEATCPERMQGCRSSGQVAPVALLVPDLTAWCLHYLLFPVVFPVSRVKARWSVIPLLQHPNRCTYTNVSWNSTRLHLPTSIIPTQWAYDESDICQCSQYTWSWLGAHPYRQRIRHELNALGRKPNTMQQITNVLLWISAIAAKELNTSVSLKRNRWDFQAVISLSIKYVHTYIVETITVERFVRHVIWLCARNEHREWGHRSMSTVRVVVRYLHRGGGFIHVRSQH
jgi:hypothetical protein